MLPSCGIEFGDLGRVGLSAGNPPGRKGKEVSCSFRETMCSRAEKKEKVRVDGCGCEGRMSWHLEKI